MIDQCGPNGNPGKGLGRNNIDTPRLAVAKRDDHPPGGDPIPFGIGGRNRVTVQPLWRTTEEVPQPSLKLKRGLSPFERWIKVMHGVRHLHCSPQQRPPPPDQEAPLIR